MKIVFYEHGMPHFLLLFFLFLIKQKPRNNKQDKQNE